jgi:hypothetical protein
MLETERSWVRFAIKSLVFFSLNIFYSTMALGSTQSLTEMPTRNLPLR